MPKESFIVGYVVSLDFLHLHSLLQPFSGISSTIYVYRFGSRDKVLVEGAWDMIAIVYLN